MLNFLKFRRDPRPDRNDAFRNAYSRGYARGRYDAAQTTGDNAKHWSFADFLSADAEADATGDKDRLLRKKWAKEIAVGTRVRFSKSVAGCVPRRVT